MRNEKRLKTDLHDFNNEVSKLEYPGRFSMGPTQAFNNVGRRSSIFSQRVPKDPRDVRKDKDNNLKVLNRFLSSKNFPDDVSLQTLRSPATNYVKNIFLFIFNQFDSSFTDFNRFDDDVKLFLNFFGFPFNLAKSYLQAPGTPSSWSYIVSTIVWLIELYKCFDTMRDEKKNRAQKTLDTMALMAEQYKSFLAGCDIEEVQEKMIEFQQEKTYKIHRETDDLKTKINALEKEIVDLKKTHTLSQRKSLFEKLNLDMQNFEKLISKKNKVIESIVKSISKQTETEKNLEEKLKEITLQKDYANHELKKQPISREELSKFNNERKELEAKLNFIQKKLMEMTKQVEEYGKLSIKWRVKLDFEAERLNDSLREISVVPAEAKFAYNKDFHLRFQNPETVFKGEDVYANIRRFTSIDLKGDLKEHLNQIHKILHEEKISQKKKIIQQEASLLALEADKKRVEKEKEEAAQILENSKHNYDALNQKFEEYKEKANNDLYSEKMKDFNASNTPAALFDLYSVCDKLIEREKAAVVEFAKRHENKKNEVMAAMEKFLAFRALRVEEFGQLQELIDKINVAFPL